MAHVAALVDIELRRVLAGLATVAATAPFVGMLGTVVGIMNSFGGLGTERSAARWSMFGHLSDALVFAALGLLVAVPALAGFLYLRNRVEVFDVEMENAALELANRLGCRRG
jgi:biopolymer transport protein ExbB/TolQ